MGRYTGKKCRLLTMFAMTTSFFLVELVVGYITNSMALVADSFHMLSDVLALIIAFLSVKMSPKKWSKNTFGWARAEVLGALVNSVFLLALCFSIFVESLKRLYETEELHNPQMILIVGVIGLIINLVGLVLFHEHGHGHSHGGHGHSHETKLSTINTLVATDDNENDERFTPPPPSILPGSQKSEGHKSASQMNMRGVFLHVLSDAMGSVVVIISALVVWLTDWQYSAYIDPALSLCLVTLITVSTWPLLKVSALILLQTVPTHIQVDGIQKQLLNVDGVLAVHEFHVWQLAGERIIASAHIRCRNLKDYMVLAEKIKKMFHEEGIHSTTIQPEFVEFEDDDTSASLNSAEDCILDCPSKDKEGCVANTCCGPSKQVTSIPRTLSTSIPESNGVVGVQFQRKSSLSLPDVTGRSASPLEGVPSNWTSPIITNLPSGTSEKLPSTHTSSPVVLSIQGLDQGGRELEGSMCSEKQIGAPGTQENSESYSESNGVSQHHRTASVPPSHPDSHTVVIDDVHMDEPQ
ncbi:zinc/cadmium resistance protein-like isoform X1 [Portunus trituberculatus]|uniref:zinc/cadmium resistance protein-like isoform X1 n=1 Tax=Portunus trituberculatus TaxID=210409 RepID=UPI001E1D12EA|nr:zinc/cadmium resistance protein-like isoform X1 [Portunus trituberculatus]XP_045136294.1 zinc/cadmium resistance protein-like isoform X1 [Portunus trituberculatus]XP_045136295.1 zinc/cadmium resistance protein-like isoform X1 [Portunus trituberculatus]XP_045136297.1 zinc/cadmium resistance protein-like isoform X1 [Portunus trituberculatus]XP_045136298.1 zinc/cadmium resistance protein-like isoform X1 [Portunus trituberculatus]